MRSVAGVALIAPARGRASKKIINIMHTGAVRCFWKPKWPWVKTSHQSHQSHRQLEGQCATQGSCRERSTFPVRYPVRAPERGPRSQTHAQRRNLGISVRPGHPAPAATLPAIPAAAPSGAQDYRWFVRDPLGLTPPGYELAPHTGLDKAPPRTRDEGRLDARATSHWSRIATQPRSCLPGAVTSA